MIKTLYLAECSKTYRQWIPHLLKGWVEKTVDLWKEPHTPLPFHSSEILLMVDEAFLAKGPGPACTDIARLLQPRRIVTEPVILLRRRERVLKELPHGVRELRRPFSSGDLEDTLKVWFPHGRKTSEVTMSKQDSKESSIPTAAPLPLDPETLQRITREAVEKTVREIVPGLAEKIIREEIRRLTE